MVVCKKCGSIAGYNSHFNAYYCTNCGELISTDDMREAGHGHWDVQYVCSVCGEIANRAVASCPCCHSKMDGADI